jgi:hypothetical protein
VGYRFEPEEVRAGREEVAPADSESAEVTEVEAAESAEPASHRA